MTIDKSEWGEGPWLSEPDNLEWTDETTGLKCHVVRNPYMGMWLGYVAVPQGHPAYGLDYHQANFDVHGGLTYSRDGSDGQWWLGFDCGQYDDLMPGMEARLRELRRAHFVPPEGQIYRDLAYAKRECVSLAWQLKCMGEVL